MKTLTALFLLLAAILRGEPATAESVKHVWLQRLDGREEKLKGHPTPDYVKQMKAIASSRAAIEGGGLDAPAQKEAARINAELALQEERRAEAAFPQIEDDSHPKSRAMEGNARWAEMFGGESNPVLRRQYARDIREYNAQVQKERIAEARKLALQCEQLTKVHVALAEDNPEKLIAQIQGMEKVIATQRRTESLSHGLGDRELSNLEWQRNVQQEQLIHQLVELRERIAHPPLR